MTEGSRLVLEEGRRAKNFIVFYVDYFLESCHSWTRTSRGEARNIDE